MIARLHNNGCEVRVDLGNTGRNWPNCGDQHQPGFPWACKWPQGSALEAAREWARANGATDIVLTGFDRSFRPAIEQISEDLQRFDHAFGKDS